MMLQHQRLKSPQAYRQLHDAMANSFIKKLDELHCSDEEQWTNEQWRRDTLDYRYHFLVADPTHHWTGVMDLFAIAVRKRRSFATEMIEMLAATDVQEELSDEQRTTVQLFRQQLQAIKDSDLQAGFEMFNRLCAMSDLSSQAKGHVLTYRGECYRLRGEWEKALSDFEEALKCLPGDVRTLIRQGITHILMRDYQKALNDLNQAITLDEKNAWALALRGETYRCMKDYQEALNDLNQAITLDEKNAWAIAVRGETYYLMKQLTNALEDLSHALALDNKNVWALVKRSEIYREMGNSQASQNDFHSALMQDENSARAFGNVPPPPPFAGSTPMLPVLPGPSIPPQVLPSPHNEYRPLWNIGPLILPVARPPQRKRMVLAIVVILVFLIFQGLFFFRLFFLITHH
jgi:tetratricopeptide (TPR) repeat protein